MFKTEIGNTNQQFRYQFDFVVRAIRYNLVHSILLRK